MPVECDGQARGLVKAADRVRFSARALLDDAGAGRSGACLADAESRLAALRALLEQVDDLYLARLTLYTRKHGLREDMPAALLLALAGRDLDLFRRTFPRVVEDGGDVRALFRLIRSGA